MAVKINNETIIDDSRNLLDAISGTFTSTLNVGVDGSLLKVENNALGENILSIKSSINSPALDITPSGKVGVGVSNPSRSLEINGDGILIGSGQNELFSVETYTNQPNIFEVYGASNLLFSVSSTNGINSINFGETDPLKIIPQTSIHDMYIGSNKILSFSPNLGTTDIFSVLDESELPLFLVNTDGKVGIGISAPLADLHINGTGLLLTDGATEVFKVSNVGTSSLSVRGLDDASIFEVTTSGYIGIGTNTPSSILQIVSGGNDLFSVSDTGTNSFLIETQGGGSALSVTSTGNIGIGTSTPTSLLEIQAGGVEVFSVSDTAGQYGELSIDGVLTLDSGFLVIDLPTGVLGMVARVTDALSPTIGSTVVGEGTSNALCWFNGTNWTVLGV